MAGMDRPVLTLKVSEKGRKATWLELFYDLIYVIVISKLTHRLLHLHDGVLYVQDVLEFIALFFPVWWCWVGHTLFSNRFDPDDAPHRLLTLLQMFFIMGMAVFVDDAFGPGSVGFAMSYVAVRGILLLMYLRVHLTNKRYRRLTSLFLGGFGFGLCFWTASIFVPSPYRYILWGIGILIEYSVPFVGRQILKVISVHTNHLPERLGLLAIIVLGESVLGIVSGITDIVWEWHHLLHAAGGFFLLSSVWWFYFETLDHALHGREMRAGHLSIYGHLPIYISLAVLSAGITHGITHEATPATVGRLIGGGLLLFIVPLQAIHYLQVEKRFRRSIVQRTLGAIAVFSVIVVTAPYQPPAVSLLGSGALLMSFTIFENKQCRLERSAAEGSQHA